MPEELVTYARNLYVVFAVRPETVPVTVLPLLIPVTTWSSIVGESLFVEKQIPQEEMSSVTGVKEYEYSTPLLDTPSSEKLLIVIGTISMEFCVTVKAVVRCFPEIVTTDVRLLVDVLGVQEMVIVCVLAPEVGLIDNHVSAAGTVITHAQLAFTTICFSPPPCSMATFGTSMRSELTTTSGSSEPLPPPPQEMSSIKGAMRF